MLGKPPRLPNFVDNTQCLDLKINVRRATHMVLATLLSTEYHHLGNNLSIKKALPASSIEPVNVKVKGVAREIGSGDNTMLTFEVRIAIASTSVT